MRQPNIFDYANSELSQDAFLVWLIKWADKNYKEINSSLNACAVSFVNELLGKDGSYKIEEIIAGRQWKNIDVWALVNNKYFIVIEDKKGTKEHSDQLNRYSKIANNHYNESDLKIKLVYFKMKEQGEYKSIEKAGFSLFQRSTMLSILRSYMGATEESKQNDILVDYYRNLERLDRNIKSYLTKPLNDWNSNSWHGFYSELQKHINGKWQFVWNPAGGFLGFWCSWSYSKIDGKEFEYYFQLEQDKFVFKLYTYKDTERKDIRSTFRRHLNIKAKEMDIDISKHGRLGKHMSIAKLNHEYRITNKNGYLDFPATVDYIKRLMELIKETEKDIKKTHNR